MGSAIKETKTGKGDRGKGKDAIGTLEYCWNLYKAYMSLRWVFHLLSKSIPILFLIF